MPAADSPLLLPRVLAELVVAQAMRGKGLGQRLMAAAEAFAREQGVPSIFIGVLADVFDLRVAVASTLVFVGAGLLVLRTVRMPAATNGA